MFDGLVCPRNLLQREPFGNLKTLPPGLKRLVDVVDGPVGGDAGDAEAGALLEVTPSDSSATRSTGIVVYSAAVPKKAPACAGHRIDNGSALTEGAAARSLADKNGALAEILRENLFRSLPY